MIPRIEHSLPTLSPERKDYLEKTRGLKPYIQYALPKWADPDTDECLAFFSFSFFSLHSILQNS